jgi:hypothetical protein
MLTLKGNTDDTATLQKEIHFMNYLTKKNVGNLPNI